MATTGRTSVISFGDAISGGGASGGEVIAHLNATPELKGVGRRGRALQRDPVVVRARWWKHVHWITPRARWRLARPEQLPDGQLLRLATATD